jgi:hypothetical protein
MRCESDRCDSWQLKCLELWYAYGVIPVQRWFIATQWNQHFGVASGVQ